MPDAYSSLLQKRSGLLDQMAGLDRMERGRLSEQFLKGQKDGQPVTWGPYPAILILRRIGEAGVLRESSVTDWVGEMRARGWKVGLVGEGGWLKT